MKALRLATVIAFSILAACSSTPKKSGAPGGAPAAAPVAAAPAATNVAGNWLMTIDSQMGPQDSKLTVNQNGKAIDGTLDTPMGSQKFTGTIEGQDLKFGFQMNAQGMDLKIDFAGTSDGQTMNGKAVFGTFGEGTFKAKRQ